MRLGRCWHAGLLLAAGIALWPAPALAGERLTLAWSAPARCPTGAQVKAEVDRLLGGRAPTPGGELVVSAEVVRLGPGEWQLRLVRSGQEPGPARIRVLHGTSCESVTDAATVVLALMIDPTAVLAAPRFRPASAPASRPVAAATRPSESLPATIPARPGGGDRRSRWELRLSAWGALDYGSLPGFSPGVGLGLGLQRGRMRYLVAVEGWPPRRATTAEREAAGGEVLLLTGTLAACRALLVAREPDGLRAAGSIAGGQGNPVRGPISGKRVELLPCVGLELGRMHAAGFGVTDPGSGSSVWVAPRAGLLAGLALSSHLVLTARVDAVFPLVRPRLRLLSAAIKTSACARPDSQGRSPA